MAEMVVMPMKALVSLASAVSTPLTAYGWLIWTALRMFQANMQAPRRQNLFQRKVDVEHGCAKSNGPTPPYKSAPPVRPLFDRPHNRIRPKLTSAAGQTRNVLPPKSGAREQLYPDIMTSDSCLFSPSALVNRSGCSLINEYFC